MNPAIQAHAVKGVASQLRSFDKLLSGRRVAALAALGVLVSDHRAGQKLWREAADESVRTDPARLEGYLRELSSQAEHLYGDLGDAFSGALTRDILLAGGELPQIAGLAATVVDQFEGNRSGFGHWFDAFIDEISAGRQSSQLTTPRSLARVMAELAPPDAKSRVLDPACGLGSILVEMGSIVPNAQLFGQDTDPVAVALTRLRLFLLGQPGTVLVGDALRAPAPWADASAAFDRVICDPPQGVSFQSRMALQHGGRTGPFSRARSEVWFVQHCLENLAPDGRAVVLLPLGFLSRRGVEADYRTHLLKSGRIEGVVGLPAGVIPWSELPTVLVVLRGRDAPELPVTLVDASDLKELGRRSTARLNAEHVATIIAQYRKPTDPKRAAVVSCDRLLMGEQDLNPVLWVEQEGVRPDSPEHLYQVARDAEARAELAKNELDHLMVYFKLRAP